MNFQELFHLLMIPSISGTVDDCKCSTNTGWHETTDNNGNRSCVKCQSNSTWDLFKGRVLVMKDICFKVKEQVLFVNRIQDA